MYACSVKGGFISTGVGASGHTASRTIATSMSANLLEILCASIECSPFLRWLSTIKPRCQFRKGILAPHIEEALSVLQASRRNGVIGRQLGSSKARGDYL
jgi:hypothetical protein